MPHKDPISAAAYKKAYYLAHRDVALANSTARRLKKQAENAVFRSAAALLPKQIVPLACQDCGVDITHTHIVKAGKRCASCVGVYMTEYRTANRVRIAELKKAWKVKNKEHVELKDRAYAQLYPQRRTVARNKWSEANPGKDTASKKLNLVARKKRVPTWLTDDDHWMIEQAYELAALRTKVFGFSWHVDHIVPLNGRKVSGLHTPYNLQIIPWRDNLRKGNRVQQGK